MAGIRYYRTNIRPTKQVNKHIQCVQWSDFWTAVHSECDLSCVSNQSYQADTCDLTWHYSENRYEIEIKAFTAWIIGKIDVLQCNINSENIKKVSALEYLFIITLIKLRVTMQFNVLLYGGFCCSYQ